MAFVVPALPTTRPPPRTRRPPYAAADGVISVSRRRRVYEFLQQTAASPAPAITPEPTAAPAIVHTPATAEPDLSAARAAATAAAARRFAERQAAIAADAARKAAEWNALIASLRTPPPPPSLPAAVPRTSVVLRAPISPPAAVAATPRAVSTPPPIASTPPPAAKPAAVASPSAAASSPPASVSAPPAPTKPKPAPAPAPVERPPAPSPDPPAPAPPRSVAEVEDAGVEGVVRSPAPSSDPPAPSRQSSVAELYSPPTATPPAEVEDADAEGVPRPSVGDLYSTSEVVRSVVDAAGAAVQSAATIFESFKDDASEKDQDDAVDNMVSGVIEDLREETAVVERGISEEEEEEEEPSAEKVATEGTTVKKTLGEKILDAIVEGVPAAKEDAGPNEDPVVGKGELVELVETGKIKSLTVTKLRRLLSTNGLKTSGRKSELIARLISFAKSK